MRVIFSATVTGTIAIAIVFRTHDGPRNHVLPCVYTPYLVLITINMIFLLLILEVVCITGGLYLQWYVLQEAYTCSGMYYRRLILVLVCITGG